MTSLSDGLSLAGIGVRFGGLVALDDVSLTVEPGRISGVIGPNGAGKTTLFNVVCGFVKPTAGTMSWAGVPLRPRPHDLARLRIGRTLQAVGLFAGMTVLENVMTGAARPAGRAGFVAQVLALPRADRSEREIRDAAMSHLDALGIARYAGDLPGPLPFAIQKRVALARALMGRPRLLLLDEPASGLGTAELGHLAALIRHLPERESCAVMLVEHHMDLVMQVCDEITVLNFGKVVASGTPLEVKGSPAVAEAYLGTEVAA